MGAFCLTMDSLDGGCFTTTTTSTTPLDVIHADGMMVNDEDDIFVFMKYSLLSLFHLFIYRKFPEKIFPQFEFFFSKKVSKG